MDEKDFESLSEIESDILDTFGTLPKQQSDASFKVYTSEVTKKQIEAMAVMDWDIKIKRSGNKLCIIVQ